MVATIAPSGVFQVRIENVPSAILVRVRGSINLLQAGKLQNRLQAVTAQRPALVVVDLSEVPFVSSLGLGVLVELRRAVVRSGGQVVVAGLQKAVREVFSASRLEWLFLIVPHVGDVLGYQDQ
jgi:anti-sigma B factor antagonist